MNRRKSNRNRGSILLMAVGILVILAMVGMTYVAVSHIDQRESASLAKQAPIATLGLGIFDRGKARLMEDLAFGSDPNTPFGKPGGWRQWVDDDSQAVDAWLASLIPVDTDGNGTLDAYPHITDLYGNDPDTTDFDNVPVRATANGRPVHEGSRWLVDTDGDGYTDSVLVGWQRKSGGIPNAFRDRDGNYFCVAARIIDLSGLLDLRVAGVPSDVAPFSSGNSANFYTDACRGCPVTDLDWSRMGTSLDLTTGDPANPGLHELRTAPKTPTLTEYNNACARKFRSMMGPDNMARGICNFGQDDLLSLLWREPLTNPAASRLTRGRLYDRLHEIDSSDGLYGNGRLFWTTESATRNLVGQVPSAGTGEDAAFNYIWAANPSLAKHTPKRLDVNQAVSVIEDPAATSPARTQARQAILKAVYDAIARDMDMAGLPDGMFGFTRPLPDNGTIERLRRALTYQYLANLIDFADADDVPTPVDVSGLGLSEDGKRIRKIYGIERQPFITEIYHKKAKKDVASDTEQYCAIELFNPYATAVDVSQYKIRCNGSDLTRPGDWPAAIPAGGRLVLINNEADLANMPPIAGPIKIAGLDLDHDVEIVRDLGDGNVVCMGVTRGDDLKIDEAALDPDNGTTEIVRIRQRDDAPARARYTLAVYKQTDYTQTAANPTAPDPKLESPNDLGENELGLPATPVYVRNGKFLNLGDLLRVFYLGPTQRTPIDEQLGKLVNADGIDTPKELAAGRWDATPGTTADYRWYVGEVTTPLPKKLCQRYLPPVPPACLLTATLTVNNPCDDKVDNNRKGDPAKEGVDEDTEDAIYGMVNINTAPEQVLKCLVPIWFGLDQAKADEFVTAICNYRRDLVDREVDAAGNPRHRPFATSGEILVPIRNFIRSLNDVDRKALVANLSRYDNAPSLNYKVSDSGTSDDGLCKAGEEITGDLAKYQAIYSRLSNLVTVRSDCFAMYVTVMRFRADDIEKEDQSGNDLPADLSEPTSVRRYVGVLDRSQCYKRTDWPQTRLFAEIK